MSTTINEGRREGGREERWRGCVASSSPFHVVSEICGHCLSLHSAPKLLHARLTNNSVFMCFFQDINSVKTNRKRKWRTPHHCLMLDFTTAAFCETDSNFCLMPFTLRINRKTSFSTEVEMNVVCHVPLLHNRLHFLHISLHSRPSPPCATCCRNRRSTDGNFTFEDETVNCGEAEIAATNCSVLFSSCCCFSPPTRQHVLTPTRPIATRSFLL